MSDTGEFVFRPFVWQPVTISPAGGPKARSGHRVVTDGVNLYSFGGFNPMLEASELDDGVWPITKPLFRELWALNLATRTWKKLVVDNVPNVLVSNSVLLLGKLLIVFGGTGVPFGSSNSNDLYVCDLSRSELRFDFVPGSGAMPEPRYGQTLHASGRYFYAIGGTNGYIYSSDVHRLDFLTMQWDEYYICRGIPGEPEPRYRHEIVAEGNLIYMLGGGTSDKSFGFKRISVFDIERQTWKTVTTIGDPSEYPEYPVARRFHSAVRIPESHDILIIGGFSRSEALDDTWNLNLKTLKWTKLPTMKLPQPTSFHSSAVTPAGKIYTFGGVVHKSGMGIRISTILQAWATIPKLKEICWEAICQLGLLHHDRVLESLPNEYKLRLQMHA